MDKSTTGVSWFEVRLYDAGPDGKARVRTLFNFMQSAADSHSRSLGTSVNLMAEKNLTWVYARFYAEIGDFPAIYENVRCETWRSGITEGMVNREFILTGNDNRELVRATSSLALIDRGTRKPVEIPDFITRQFESGRGRALCYVPFPVEKPDKNDYIYPVRARCEDIDINGHMNNASYAQMFFESGYSALEGNSILSSMDIVFRGEILYNDVINCGSFFLDESKTRILHSAFNENRGRISSTAVTEWR